MPPLSKNLELTRKYLKTKLLNESPLISCDKEHKQITDLIQRTVINGESNSVLLIGPRCSGKTTLINNILKELSQEKSVGLNSVIVELHGLIHTDDRLALKEITTQMELDNAVDGKVFGSFAENLAFLLACLKSGDKESSKSVIVVLEEFDLFCTHHNQTLLYNLFDVSQSAQTPLCIIGITCRLDVIELLEKRVKSRFSHRQIFLFPAIELDDWVNRVEYFLTFTDPSNHQNITKSFKSDWNKHIKQLTNDKRFKQLIQRLFDSDCNERILKNILIQIVTSLGSEKNKITFDDFECHVSNFEKDEIIEILGDLTILELCLLIAIKHHCDIYDNQSMNFEMIYTRYVKFANANSNVQSVQRPVVMKAFEHLQNMELIAPISQGLRLQKEYQMFKLLVSPLQILDFIKKSPGIPTEVTQWAGSSII